MFCLFTLNTFFYSLFDSRETKELWLSNKIVFAYISPCCYFLPQHTQSCPFGTSEMQTRKRNHANLGPCRSFPYPPWVKCKRRNSHFIVVGTMREVQDTMKPEDYTTLIHGYETRQLLKRYPEFLPSKFGILSSCTYECMYV